MTNPLSVAAVASFANVANLTSLPSATAYGLGSVGTATTQYYDDNVAPIQIKSGASAVSATGTASLYLIVSEDGSLWTNGISPSTASDQSALLVNLPALQQISVNANATSYQFKEFSVYASLGYMPSFWAIIVYNQSGAAFDGTGGNFSAKHSLISYA